MTDPDTLRDWAAACYRALGLGDADALLVADTLIQADLWGHASHGVMRVFWYADRLLSGATKADADPRPDDPDAALTGMDGEDGMGQVAAQRAMDQAIRNAQRHGIGGVAVRNSGHFGTAMYYTRQAAVRGCLGFLVTNASPAMAPWGGMEKRVGTNPWSWAAPAGKHPPMMLDIANTAVARGKLYAAKARGEPIPEGWAIDTEGRATTDPAAGIAGTILPMAGHKGYAIAVLADVLAGIASGSGFGASIRGPYMPEGRAGVGHLALVIDISRLRPLADFEADMERLIAELRACPRQPGVDRILYPGEMEADAEARHRAGGIALPEGLKDELRARSAALGVPAPF